ncbi:MAG TPA: hypothetical protein VLW75_09765 [Rhizomicrobium sp.]|nr:hypothetical protein [Rhizomicrobium sp.]
MRNSWAGAASFAAVLVFGGAAFASGTPSVDAEQYTQQDVPTVAPGDEISIACAALNYTAPANDVRVVLTVSAEPSGAPTGYKKVLATDEQLLTGAVRVKIPDMPDLENHMVDLNVYVVSADGSEACDAGQMKIADGLKKPAPVAKDSKS